MIRLEIDAVSTSPGDDSLSVGVECPVLGAHDERAVDRSTRVTDSRLGQARDRLASQARPRGVGRGGRASAVEHLQCQFARSDGERAIGGGLTQRGQPGLVAVDLRDEPADRLAVRDRSGNRRRSRARRSQLGRWRDHRIRGPGTSQRSPMRGVPVLGIRSTAWSAPIAASDRSATSLPAAVAWQRERSTRSASGAKPGRCHDLGESACSRSSATRRFVSGTAGPDSSPSVIELPQTTRGLFVLVPSDQITQVLARVAVLA